MTDNIQTHDQSNSAGPIHQWVPVDDKADTSVSLHWTSVSDVTQHGLSLNLLCDVAMPLIGLAVHLPTCKKSPEVTVLYQSVRNKINAAIGEVRALGCDTATQQVFSYALCSLLDEIVMGTRWGKHSAWSQRSLLSAFHQETWGGTNFFTLLDHLSVDATKHQHLLELMYLCLCAGIKGKYGNLPKGDEAVEKVIKKLHGILRPLRGETPTQLFDPLSNVVPRNFRLKRQWPIWMPWAVAIAVLAGAYTFYAVRLHFLTQEVLASLDGILKL